MEGLTTTVECRWWAPGRIREEFMAWFASLGDLDVEMDRVDLYLLDESRPDRSVKLRDGTRREVKLRTHREPTHAAGAPGWVERWSRTSVPHLSEPPRGTTIIEVRKNRFLITLDGCRVELTEASIDGRAWHSLALESDDRPPGSTTVEQVLARLADAGLTRFLGLTQDRSHGYAEHLLATFDAVRSPTASSTRVAAGSRTLPRPRRRSRPAGTFGPVTGEPR